jgi:tetratricopeptide (TPR) repeat protein
VRRSVLLVLIGCLLGAGSPGQAFDPASVYPTEAAFTASVGPLRAAIERNPRDVRSRFLLGDAYLSAWRLYRAGVISYGATYDRPAEAQFRAIIRMDPNHLGAHLALYTLLQSRGEWEAAEALLPRLLSLSRDVGLLAQVGAVPRPPSPPQAPRPQVRPEGPTVVPPPDVRFRPEDYFVIVDLATGLIYRLNCPHLPRIERAAFFLIKWEAIAQGYRPATGPCAP